MADNQFDDLFAEAEGELSQEAENIVADTRDQESIWAMEEEANTPSIADRVGQAAFMGGIMPAASKSVLPMMWEGAKTGADTLAHMVIPPLDFIQAKYQNPEVTMPNGERIGFEGPTAAEQAKGLGVWTGTPVPENTMVDPVQQRQRWKQEYRESSLPAFLHSMVQDDFIAPIQRMAGAAVYGTVDWAKALTEQAINDPASIAPEIVAQTIKVPGAKQGASMAMRYGVRAGEALARSFAETATESSIAEIDPEFATRLEKEGGFRERFMNNAGKYALFTLGGEAFGDFAKGAKGVQDIAEGRVEDAYFKAAGFSPKNARAELAQTGTKLVPTAKSLLSNPEMVDYEIKSQAARAVEQAKKLGLYQGYTTPKNFYGRLKDVERGALEVRGEIFKKAEQSLTERVIKGAPAPDLKLPVLRGQLERLTVEDPTGPLTAFVAKTIKRIENVAANRLTGEKAQQIALKRGMIDEEALRKLHPTKVPTFKQTDPEMMLTYSKSPKIGVDWTGEIRTIPPGRLEGMTRFSPLQKGKSKTLPPEAEAPLTAQLQTLYGLRSGLARDARVFWAGKHDTKGYRDAATLAAGRKEIDNVIEDYLEKLQKSGALTSKEVAALRQTDQLLEMTNTLTPMTRDWTAGIDSRNRGTTRMPGLDIAKDAQNTISSRVAAANVSGRGIMEDPAALLSARTMGNVAGGVARGAEATQQFMGNVPLRLAAQLEQASEERPLPRNVEDFFSLPQEEIQRRMPSVAQDYAAFQRKTPEEQRYFLQQAIKGNDALFEPSPVAGFSFVDGRIDPDQREALLQRLNKDMKTPGADMKYYAALIRAVGNDDPIVNQKRSSLQAVDRLTRLFQDTPFDIEMEGDFEMQGPAMIANQQ